MYRFILYKVGKALVVETSLKVNSINSSCFHRFQKKIGHTHVVCFENLHFIFQRIIVSLALTQLALCLSKRL